MPITDQKMNLVAQHVQKYVYNTYHTLTGLMNEYETNASTIDRNTMIRRQNYDAMTKAQFDAKPKFGTFYGYSHNDIFGNTNVFGSVHTFEGTRPGEMYIEMASNKVMVESQGSEELSSLKIDILYRADQGAASLMENFRQELLHIVFDNMDDLFEILTLQYEDLRVNPYNAERWKDEVQNIQPEDWPKLKYIFDYYKVNYNEAVQIPLFKKLFSLYGENGDFDKYKGNDLDLFFYLSGYSSVREDMYFSHLLKEHIKKRLDREFDEIDIDTFKMTDTLFADTYDNIDKNDYLDYKQKDDIKGYVKWERSKLIEKRGF